MFIFERERTCMCVCGGDVEREGDRVSEVGSALTTDMQGANHEIMT